MKNRHLLRVIAVLTVLLLPVVIGMISPNIDNERSLCPFLVLTGCPCPSCGLTKAIIHLYKGEIALSWHYHWWAGVFVAGCLLMLVLSLYDWCAGKDVCDKLFNNATLWQLICVAVVVTFVVRQVFGL